MGTYSPLSRRVRAFFMAKDKKAKLHAYREQINAVLPTVYVTPRRPGRPETYTVELGLLICEKMIEYGRLTAACRSCDELPDERTVYSWALRHPEFDRSLTQAWEALGLRWADEIIDIADDEEIEPNARRVKIEARKWVLSKLAARRFGDKLTVAGDPDNPLKVLHQSVELNALSNAELDALQVFAQARLEAIEVDSENVEDVEENG